MTEITYIYFLLFYYLFYYFCSSNLHLYYIYILPLSWFLVMKQKFNDIKLNIFNFIIHYLISNNKITTKSILTLLYVKKINFNLL